MSAENALRRKIRSYVLRGGRLTLGQQRAMERHWPQWGLSVDDGPLDIDASFGRSAPTVLEIGFGMGASLAEMAAAQPQNNFIGIEVHPPGVGSLLMASAKREIDNIRVYRHDAIEVLQHCIPNASLQGVQLYFPDPWHKKKHHKRRIVQQDFVDLIAAKLVPDGWFHMATDWQEYAQHMLDVMEPQPLFANSAGPGNFSARPEWRPKTKFEQRGERLGHGVWDLLYRRIAQPKPS